MASGWSAMSKIPGVARSDKAKETHMDKLTPFFKKKKRILKKGLTVKAKLFCPEIAGLFCRIAGLFCHDSRANLSLKPVCFGIAIS